MLHPYAHARLAPILPLLRFGERQPKTGSLLDMTAKLLELKALLLLGASIRAVGTHIRPSRLWGTEQLAVARIVRTEFLLR